MRIGNFGFLILDFGLKKEMASKAHFQIGKRATFGSDFALNSKIENPKSKIDLVG